MKRTAIATVLMLASLAAPAGAHDLNGTTVTFVGAIPCAVACSYWVDNGFTPCEYPFPPGSFHDKVIEPAPSVAGKITVLEGTLDPEIDSDVFFCATDDRRELAQGSSPLDEPCDDLLPYLPFPTGCHEDMATPAIAGQQVLFRVYNWTDVPRATGEYAFWFI